MWQYWRQEPVLVCGQLLRGHCGGGVQMGQDRLPHDLRAGQKRPKQRLLASPDKIGQKNPIHPDRLGQMGRLGRGVGVRVQRARWNGLRGNE